MCIDTNIGLLDSSRTNCLITLYHVDDEIESHYGVNYIIGCLLLYIKRGRNIFFIFFYLIIFLFIFIIFFYLFLFFYFSEAEYFLFFYYFFIL
jgi:hypothetical protein